MQRLSPGETVRIQLGNQLVKGRVLEELTGAPRTYRVATTDGQELRRNRLHIHQTLEKTPHIDITAHQEELATAFQQAGQSHTAGSTSQDQSVRQPPAQVTTDSTSETAAEQEMESTPDREPSNPTPSPTEDKPTAAVHDGQHTSEGHRHATLPE